MNEKLMLELAPSSTSDDNQYKKTSSRVELSDTVFRLLAENCLLKLRAAKTRQDQQQVIISYAMEFTRLNDDPKRHARAYLESVTAASGMSKRTLLRMLPTNLKDYSKMMNRLGKTKMQSFHTNRCGAACYQPPE